MLVQKIYKIYVFALISTCFWAGLKAEIKHLNSVQALNASQPGAFFNLEDPRRVALEAQIKEVCPANIYPIFDRSNLKWRSYFAKNCKNLLKDKELDGEFGHIYAKPSDGLSLEYAFFKGHKNASKLIVIAGGAFYDKHFSLPYVILLNKVLGYSCLLADYRGHENSWHKAKESNPLYLMREKTRGIDSSLSTFGKKEGADFARLIAKILSKKDYIQETHALGICFGAIVLARAQNFYKERWGKQLFKDIALISPLPNIHELILLTIENSETLEKFVGVAVARNIKATMAYKIANSLVKLKLGWINKLLSTTIASYLKISQFDGLQEFAKLDTPILMIASEDSDCIVNKRMAKLVWNKIPSTKKVFLWSFGVGHLFNWWDETAQLIIALDSFFQQSNFMVQNPLEYLK